MTMDLVRLFEISEDIVGRTDDLMSPLDWLDRVLPHITAACRQSVIAKDIAAFGLWRHWIDDGGIDVIRHAGDVRTFEWRRAWLSTLTELGRNLAAKRTLLESDRRDLVESAAAAPFDAFPTAFWLDLIDLLTGVDRPSSVDPVVAAFPLVLTEPMSVDGEIIDVIVAEFVVERSDYGSAIYIDPDQVAIRCLSPDFLATFTLATAALTGEDGARVRLRARIPAHEVFLQKLVLSGPSGGGALSMGVRALIDGRANLPHDLALSFALTNSPDGACAAVGGAWDKVRGCAKNGIRRLIVADEQASQVVFHAHLQSVAIVGVKTVDEAFAALDRGTTEGPTEASATDAVDPGVDDVAPIHDGGVLPLKSRMYLKRASDDEFHEAIDQRPMIVLVKGARQIGKTSLLVRGVDRIRQSGIKLVYIDLQSIGRDSLQTQRGFYSALSRIFALELKLDVTMDDLYDERDGPNKNFENFLLRYVVGAPVVWFMDEVDMLFEYDYYTDVFSLMRSWHNRRSIHTELANLTLVLCYATETHLLIEDAYQSPFNVGIKVELEDFTLSQIDTLNNRMRRPLMTDSELQRFGQLVGGHPHLVCQGLFWMSSHGRTIKDFAEQACLEHGPFGTHLRRLLLIAQNTEHVVAVREILQTGRCNSPAAFLNLRRAGVVVGDDCSNPAFRCEIYAEYLRRNLPQTVDTPAAVKPRQRSLLDRILRKEARL